MLWVLITLVVLWVITRYYLRGEDLSVYDRDTAPDFGADSVPGPELSTVLERLSGSTAELNSLPRKERLIGLREYMDNMFADREFAGSFEAVDVAGIPSEWVIAPGADSSRRLLYIHGGAFMMGSPRSHRVITHRFSEIANAAVLAIDYRLMPENRRRASNDDCRIAYQWMLGNGPSGGSEAGWVAVAGDSAGGNLSLALSAWIRNQGIRAPDAVVALSPATDGTMGSPSARSNMQTDVMLKPMFEPLAKIPRVFLLWGAWIFSKACPSDPEVSPVFGSLAGLPPTLVQASQVEVLLDDARRYVHKAQDQGSPVRLQVWDHMPHVWQIFYPDLPEAGVAFDEIEKFLNQASA